MRKWTMVLAICLAFTAAGWADDTKVPAPRLEVVQMVVDDSVNGNNNGIIEPGETVALEIKVRNVGTATALDVNGTLYSNEPGLTIGSRMSQFGDILPGQLVVSQPPRFEVTLATTLPCGKDLDFTLVLNSANADTTTFIIQPMRDLPSKDMATFAEDVVIYSADTDDQLGIGVSSGDINGDGYQDMIIGASWGDGTANGRTLAGEVWIIYGTPSLASTIDLSTPPSDATFIYGADASDYLGGSISSGDINGDGYDDVILGVLESDGQANGKTKAGEVWVVYGSASPATDIDLASPLPSSTTVIYGAESYSYTGYGVSSGDINGDGYDDVILGAPGGGDGGEVWIFYGSISPDPVIDLGGSPGNTTVILGADSGDTAGDSVSSGDINGDGYDDVLLGADDADGAVNGKSKSGEVWVIYGSASLASSIDLATSPSNSAVIYGADPDDFTGRSVSSGDINGDGYDDLLLSAISSNGPANGRQFAGEVWVIYGSLSLPSSIDLAAKPPNTSVIYGADPGDYLGRSLSSGDLNGDGYDDVILGTRDADGPGNGRQNSGEIWVVYGSSEPATVIDTVLLPIRAEVIYGADLSDRSGGSVSSGDVNGDGYDDVILGAYNADGPSNGGSNNGEAGLFYGRPHSHYFLEPESYAWIDATGGTDIGLACDTCCKEVSFDFNFEFYGRDYSSVWICDDGYVTFSAPSDLSPWNYCITDDHSPDNLIAAFWDDLNPGAGGSVYTLLEGSVPNRRLTIEWSGVPYYPNDGDATFEITLFESTNQILVQYQDTIFGHGADSGSWASAGVENIKGVNGQQYSCYAANLTDSSAWRSIPFGSYPVFSDDMESGANGWTTMGTDAFWHQEAASCAPFSRSPSTSWYYGDATCDYNDGNSLSYWGLLSSPQINVDYYGNVYQFMRNEMEGNTYDHSFFQVNEDGGGFYDVEEIFFDDPVNWYSWRTDFSASSGHAINLGYYCYQDWALWFFGWMVDDVEVWGCDVYGAKAMSALAYARPAPVCETKTYLLDGTGSFAQGCQGLTYQWNEDGGPMGGATTLQYTVPSNHATGLYEYTLEATCSNPVQVVTSDPVAVRVVPMPPEVPEDSFMLEKINGGADIHMVWVDVAGGDIYNVYRDLDPSSGFSSQDAQAPTGPTGVDISMPGETLVFYLVAGVNDTCGVGPKR